MQAMRQLKIKMCTTVSCDRGAVVGSYFHCLGSRLRISPRYWGCLKRGGLQVARVARVMHTTILSNNLLLFWCFQLLYSWHSFTYSVRPPSWCLFYFLKKKVHRLIFRTYHTDPQLLIMVLLVVFPFGYF